MTFWIYLHPFFWQRKLTKSGGLGWRKQGLTTFGRVLELCRLWWETGFSKSLYLFLAIFLSYNGLSHSFQFLAGSKWKLWAKFPMDFGFWGQSLSLFWILGLYKCQSENYTPIFSVTNFAIFDSNHFSFPPMGVIMTIYFYRIFFCNSYLCN